MKKPKAEDVDLFYLNNKDDKKGNVKKIKQKKDVEVKNGIFSFDDEIVIGVTKKKNNSKNNKSKKTEGNKDTKTSGVSRAPISTNKKQNEQTKKQVMKINKKLSEKEIQKQEKREKRIKTLVKWTVFLIILIGAILYLLLSPVFNIKNIVVENEGKITKGQVISLSKIMLEDNLFRVNISEAIEKIKENAYVESVNIHRVFPNEIKIEVKERVASFMIEFLNSYVYINNQGYMLEISEERLELPVIIGYESLVENMKAGNRLIVEDLYKLEAVIRIMESANNHEVGSIVTKIDISNKNNYTLILEGEGKTVYLGDASNINTRILYMKEIVEREKGVVAEIFIDGDLNKQRVYLREKIN